MPLAASRQAVEDLALVEHVSEELAPEIAALARVAECLRVADDDHAISGAAQENVQALWREHEADVVCGVAARQTDHDDLPLLALGVVCGDM